MSYLKPETRSRIQSSGNSGIFWKATKSKFIENVAEKVQKQRATVVRGIFQDAVKFSPVRTGRLRASWRVGIGAKDESYAPVNTGKRVYGAPKPPLASTLRSVPLSTPIYISNSVPYIKYLEYGSPTTKEYAMLRRAIASRR